MAGLGSSRRGAVSEAYFTTVAMRKGWQVCRPYQYAIPYDLLVRFSDDGDWNTVKVKTAYMEAPGERTRTYVRVSIRKANGKRYQPGDFDVLAVVLGNDVWMFPWEVIT